MKRKILILAVAAAIFSIAAYGTFAYFSAEGTAVNVITAGNVKMALHDETPEGGVFAQNGLDRMMPGDTVDRIVYVENTGDNAFFARVKLNCEVLADGGQQLSFDKISLDIDTAKWEPGGDGWYYYISKVEKSFGTEPLFTRITFEPGMGNEYMNADVNIEIIAQAVQCANNEGKAKNAAGWPSV